MTLSHRDNFNAQQNFDPPLGDSEFDLDSQLLIDLNAYMAGTKPANNQDSRSYTHRLALQAP